MVKRPEMDSNRPFRPFDRNKEAVASLALYCGLRGVTNFYGLLYQVRQDATYLGFSPKPPLLGVSFAGFELDILTRQLTVPSGKEVGRLTGAETMVAYILISARGEPVQHAKLANALKPIGKPLSSIENVYVYRLRRTIGSPDNGRIQTVRGVGYKLTPN